VYQPENVYPVLIGVGSVIADPLGENVADGVEFPAVALS
jgi:hypothetical protein